MGLPPLTILVILGILVFGKIKFLLLLYLNSENLLYFIWEKARWGHPIQLNHYE